MTSDTAGAALRAAARIGPYFVWEPYDGAPGWRPLNELLDAEVIVQRVESGRRMLAAMGGLAVEEIEERAVASTIFLGLASRLLSPLVGSAALGGVLPLPDAGRMWWRPVDSGPMPIAWRDLRVQSDPAQFAPALARTAVQDLVGPVLDVFRQQFTLSPQVLRGDVASALGGAAAMIADTAPQAAERAATIVGTALTLPPLAGSATLVRPDPDRARWFLVRNNCCLYYRIPGGGTCGDCVLTPADVRHRNWQSVLARDRP